MTIPTSRWLRKNHRDVFVWGAVLSALTVAGPAHARDEYLVELAAKARSLRLHESRQWRVLLHYRPMWYGGWRSEADGLGFFNAGRIGKTDPRRELEATLAAFRAPAVQAPARQHPQCRFPARWAYLKSALAVDPARFADQPCPLFETWRTAIAAEKVTLVYSTAYLNSPASMYGHTFLRLSRTTSEGNPLLDYIMNFAADIDTKSGLVYMVKGVAGGFRGHFYVMPYYVKIQEYSNMESRDLWDYELALDGPQIERLVAHAWETRTTHFDYFFFSENCSYFLLELLEVANPDLHLTDEFGAWVIPSNTVRTVLAVPGLVRRTAPRPSLRAVMNTRKQVLNGPERDAAHALSQRGKSAAEVFAAFPRERQALTIDAATDLLRFREGFQERPSEAFARTERELLILRGRTGVPPQTVSVEPAVDAPERGHLSFRLGLGGGAGRYDDATASAFQDVSLRIALHDHLDRPRGYVEGAVLEMASFRFRFTDRTRGMALDRADLVNIVSPTPFDPWAPKPSWKAWFGGAQDRSLGCDGWRCLVGGAGAGGGFSFRIGRPLLFYGLLESDVGAGAALSPGYRVGLGGSATALLRLTSFWRLTAGTRYVHYLLGDDRRSLGGGVAQALDLGRRAQLRAVGEIAGLYRQARLEVVGYF